MYVFGYLKKKMNRRIVINSRDPIIVKNGAEEQFTADLHTKLTEFYPDAKEEEDSKVHKPLFDDGLGPCS